jgi:oligoendopeptidase F
MGDLWLLQANRHGQGVIMKKIARVIIAVTAVFVFCESSVLCQTRERSEIAAGDTWKLEDLYASDAEWGKAKEKVVGQFDEILKYKGKLATSASGLLSCLDFDSNLSKEFIRLHTYAAMKSDQDTRDSKYLAMKQEMQQLGTDYSSKASFIEPEIAKMDKTKIDKFIGEEPDLKIFKMYLYDEGA